MSAKAISDSIQLWVANNLDLNNIEHMLMDVKLDEDSEKVYEDTVELQQILECWRADLQNTYDNYVCFYGKEERAQMQKFQHTAYRSAITGFELSNIDSTGIPETILQNVHSKFSKIYKNHNSKIILHEKQLIRHVIQRIKGEYEKKLRRCILESPMKSKPEGLENINKRMLAYCVATVVKSMNFNGKTNNALREITSQLESLLRDCIFEQATKIFQEDVEKHREKLTTISKNCTASDLEKIRDEFVANVKCAMNDDDEKELLLDTYFLSLVEQHEEKITINQHRTLSSCIGIHLTYKWVWPLLCIQRDGQTSLPIAPKRKKPCYSAVMETSNNDVKWVKKAYKAGSFKGVTASNREYLFDIITNNTGTSRGATTRFIEKVKAAFAGYSNGEDVRQILIVIPSWFSFSDRNLVRECSKNAHFERVVLLTESSLAAYSVFRSLSIETAFGSLVLIVIVRAEGIQFEIYDKSSEKGEVTGVTLLAQTSEKWSPWNLKIPDSKVKQLPPDHIETVHGTYERALSQLDENQRKLVQFYQVIPDFPDWAMMFDGYFKHGQQMKQIYNFSGNIFRDVFSTFSNDPSKVGKFLDALTKTVPNPSTLPRRLPEELTAPEEETPDEDLRKRRYDLMKKCDCMEAQLEDGKIHVGKLTRDIIVDAIGRARAAALEHMVDGKEAQELDALFKEHNFK